MQRKRVIVRLVMVSLLSVAMMAIGLVVVTGPASAASITDCNNHPGNTNCNGAQVVMNDACWNSSYVVGPTVGGEFTFADGPWQFRTELRYSTTCQSNFAATQVTTTGCCPYEVSNKIRRLDGPNGAYLMEHGPWITMYLWSGGSWVLSPLVWSPTNKAQACVSTRNNDQAQCSVAF